MLERNDFMSSNSNTVGTGTAIILTVLILIFIGWIISLFEPKFAMNGCKNEVAEGSKYKNLSVNQSDTNKREMFPHIYMLLRNTPLAAVLLFSVFGGRNAAVLSKNI